MMSNVLRQLDEVLADAPDRLSFRAVCALVDTSAGDRSAALAIERAASELNNWSDEVCAVDDVDSRIIASRFWSLVRTATAVHAEAVISDVSRFAKADLRKLSLVGISEDVCAKLQLSEWFPSLRWLALQCTSFKCANTAHVFQNLIPSGTCTLDLGFVLADDTSCRDFLAYVSSQRAHKLTRLRLTEIDRGALATLFNDPPPSLEQIDLGWDQTTLAALGQSDSLSRRIKSLDLAGRRLGDGGIQQVADLSGVRTLESLDLSVNGLSPAGIRALVESQITTSLSALSLYGNPVGDEGVTLLAKSDFPCLRELDCRQIDCSDAGVASLAHAGFVGQLESLNLGQNRIGDSGVSVLSRADAGRLRSLHLWMNDISNEGAKAIAGAEWLAGVTDLSIRGNDVGDDGFESLASSGQLCNVRELDAFGNSMTQRCLQVLADASTLQNITTLSIGGAALSVIDPTVAVQFASAQSMPKLRSLEMWSRGLNDKVAIALSQAEGWERLRWLELHDASLSDVGLEALASSPLLRGLWVLRITGSNASFGDNGIRALARSNVLTQVVELGIEGIDCSEAAMYELANSPIARRVDRVCVSCHRNVWKESNVIRPVLRSFLEHVDDE